MPVASGRTDYHGRNALQYIKCCGIAEFYCYKKMVLYKVKPFFSAKCLLKVIYV
jgi:hypothetical protein